MKRSVSVTEKWGRVTRYEAEAEADIAGYHIWADDSGEPGVFTVITNLRMPDGRLCGMSSRWHDRVPGGRRVAERIMDAGRAAVAAGRARHDQGSCEVCTPPLVERAS